jgi:hypothetical protein
MLLLPGITQVTSFLHRHLDGISHPHQLSLDGKRYAGEHASKQPEGIDVLTTLPCSYIWKETLQIMFAES